MDRQADSCCNIKQRGWCIDVMFALLCVISLLAARAGEAAESGRTKPYGQLRFAPVAPPTSFAERRAVRASGSVAVDGITMPIGYTTLLRTGQTLPNSAMPFGTSTNQFDQALKAGTTADFSSLLAVGDRIYNLTHFHTVPAAIYLTELSQDTKTGALRPLHTRPIDTAHVRGLYNTCAGSVTPWNTHLGSEEYEPDAARFEEVLLSTTVEGSDRALNYLDREFLKMLKYFIGVRSKSATIAHLRESGLNPYDYGYPVEVKILEDGQASLTKLYALGRASIELAYVMPDQRTVYITDDTTNGGLYMFVAERPADLSQGVLYAARWHQTSDEGGGAAEIRWIDLGAARENDIRAAIPDTRFSSLFATELPRADGTCRGAGFISVNTSGGNECLKVKDGMDILASRLETRRYAAIRGATTEFSDEEGITFDPVQRMLYLAMSTVAKGMEDERSHGSRDASYDVGDGNHVRLNYNPCGAVYRLPVAPNQHSWSLDANDRLIRNHPINSEYVATAASALVVGDPARGTDENNACNIDAIANPDNLTFITGYDTLIIAEDAGRGHMNDAVWAYNTTADSLTRIMTTPYGSEATSVYWYPDIGGWAYLMVVVQHPYYEDDQSERPGYQFGTDSVRYNDDEAKDYVGYMGPFRFPK